MEFLCPSQERQICTGSSDQIWHPLPVSFSQNKVWVLEEREKVSYWDSVCMMCTVLRVDGTGSQCLLVLWAAVSYVNMGLPHMYTYTQRHKYTNRTCTQAHIRKQCTIPPPTHILVYSRIFSVSSLPVACPCRLIKTKKNKICGWFMAAKKTGLLANTEQRAQSLEY